MTEHEQIAGLAEQIELARKYLDEWPHWLRSNAHFSGADRVDEVPSHPEEPTAADHAQIAAREF